MNTASNNEIILPMVLIEKLYQEFIDNENSIIFDLLKEIPESFVINEYNYTLFHYFSMRNCPRIISYLIEIGWNVNVKTSNGTTPLILAMRSDFIEIVKLLIDGGAIRNYEFYENAYKPMTVATDSSSAEMLKLLISAGFSVDVKLDENGSGPLHMAALAENHEVACSMIDVLLEAGVDVNVTDDAGFTTLHTRVGIMRQPWETYDHSVAHIVRKLLDRGANIEALTEGEQSTPLHLAVFNGVLPAVKQLIESGSDVNCTTPTGDTPLHIAVTANFNIDLIKLLCDKGASINEKNHDDFTPLEWCLVQSNIIQNHVNIPAVADYDDIFESLSFYKVSVYIELVIELYKRGAHIYDTEFRESTALYVAMGHIIHSDIVSTLLGLGSYFKFNDPLITEVMKCPHRRNISKVLLKYLAQVHDVYESNNLDGFNLENLLSDRRNFYIQCRNELNTMKSSYSCCAVTMFDLFKGRVPPFYVKTIVKAFETHEISHAFPIYQNILIDNFNKEYRRHLIRTTAVQNLMNVFRWNENRYLSIAENIVDNLPDDDMIQLALAHCPRK